jgi:hypothetical protein
MDSLDLLQTLNLPVHFLTFLLSGGITHLSSIEILGQIQIHAYIFITQKEKPFQLYLSITREISFFI